MAKNFHRHFKTPGKPLYWIIIAYILLGWFFPVIGLVAIICMIGPVLFSIWKGRWWCGNVCPRGNLYSRLLSKYSPHREIPKFVRTFGFRLFMVFFIFTMFGIQLSFVPWSEGGLPMWAGIGKVFWTIIVVTTIVGYPLFGTYALAATLLMALWCWRLEKDRWQALVDSLLGVLALVAIPLLCYQYVYYQTNMVNLWWTALPIFKILEVNNEYYVPYALLGACLLILTIVKWNQEPTKPVKPIKPNKSKKPTQPTKPRISWQAVVVVAVLAATVYGVWKMWMKDENFHREVAMMHYAEETRWEEMLEEAAEQQDVPTRAIVMMRNLALSRLGRQGSEMCQYLNGSKKPDSPFAPPASMIVGDLIYYNYGMMNDCHHMCIEGGVEFGWRVQHLKYLARCGMMAGETNVMYKYTEMLKHTLFHGQWAEHLEELQQQPEKRRADSETGPVMHMLHYPDAIGVDNGYAERYLMNHLAVMDSDDPYFQEQCLLATLWTKDSSQFWPRFAKYLSQHPGKPIPRCYQEAAHLYTVMEGNAPFQVPVDEVTKKTFDEFARTLEQYDGRDIEEAREALYPLYGKTYFFEYYLMEGIAYL